MSYDKLYGPEDFRFLANLSCGAAGFEGPQRARYESVQLFVASDGDSAGAVAGLDISFGRTANGAEASCRATVISARLAYAGAVLTLAYRQTAEQFPDWLEHRWVPFEPGWRMIEFTSAKRGEAEAACEGFIREVADSGKVWTSECYAFEANDYRESWWRLDVGKRRLRMILNLPTIDAAIRRRMTDLIVAGQPLELSTAPLRFSYAEIAPYVTRVDPRMLSLLNAEEGRPPRTELDKQLFKAVGDWNIEEALRLIDAGADVNALNEGGETPLTVLADSWPKADYGNEEPMPLYWQRQRIAMLSQLLDRGADINLFGYEGLTSLTVAVIKQELEVVEFLLGRGANPNFNQFPDEPHVNPGEKSSALFYAACDWDLAPRGTPAEARQERIYKALIEAGAQEPDYDDE